MPPPMTSSRSGTSAISSAPVESMMRSSSGKPGSSIGREPAAMMQCVKSIVVPSTSISFGEVNFASPVTTLTLRCLARPSRPPVSLPTTSCFQPRSLSRSISGSPKVTPKLRRLLGLGDHPGRVQQRLRGDAADVEADAAEHVEALDEDDLEAEVGGAEGGRVAARAGADDDDAARLRRARRPVASSALVLALARRRRPCLLVVVGLLVGVLASPIASSSSSDRRRRPPPS